MLEKLSKKSFRERKLRNTAASLRVRARCEFPHGKRWGEAGSRKWTLKYRYDTFSAVVFLPTLLANR